MSVKQREWQETLTRPVLWVLVIAAFILGVALGTSSVQEDEQASPGADTGEVTFHEDTSTPVDTEAVEPIVLEGSGTKATDEVVLRDGKATITSVNKGGDTNFNVYLVDENGEELDLLANELGGDSETSKSISVVGGSYTFNVSSGGTWKVTVEQ